MKVDQNEPVNENISIATRWIWSLQKQINNKSKIKISFGKTRFSMSRICLVRSVSKVAIGASSHGRLIT